MQNDAALRMQSGRSLCIIHISFKFSVDFFGIPPKCLQAAEKRISSADKSVKSLICPAVPAGVGAVSHQRGDTLCRPSEDWGLCRTGAYSSPASPSRPRVPDAGRSPPAPWIFRSWGRRRFPGSVLRTAADWGSCGSAPVPAPPEFRRTPQFLPAPPPECSRFPAGTPSAEQSAHSDPPARHGGDTIPALPPNPIPYGYLH